MITLKGCHFALLLELIHTPFQAILLLMKTGLYYEAVHGV